MESTTCNGQHSHSETACIASELCRNALEVSLFRPDCGYNFACNFTTDNSPNVVKYVGILADLAARQKDATVPHRQSFDFSRMISACVAALVSLHAALAAHQPVLQCSIRPGKAHGRRPAHTQKYSELLPRPLGTQLITKIPAESPLSISLLFV